MPAPLLELGCPACCAGCGALVVRKTFAAALPLHTLQDRATRIIETSGKLRDAMGGSVRAQPPVSQSSMSQSINGRLSKTVTLIMPVVGGNGRVAQVRGRGASPHPEGGLHGEAFVPLGALSRCGRTTPLCARHAGPGAVR